MRVKYKPKPKIPVGSVPRERETTPSAEPGKETTTATAARQPTTTTSSQVIDSVSITREDLRTSQEPTVLPVSSTSCTTCSTVGPTKTTDSISDTYLTNGTTLTGLGGISPIVSSTTRHESDFETSYVATNSIRTSTTDYLNTSLPDSTNVRENNDYSHPMNNDQLNCSPSFGEGLPTALQAESVAICDDDNSIMNTEDTSTDSSRTTVQSSSHRYPSFIESLSSSMSQVASSHRALGLDQPADDELVSTSAVEATYRRRCYEEPDAINEEMDVFNSCPDDRIATSSSIDLQQTEIGGEVEVGNDEDNDEAVSKDGDDGDDTAKQTKSKRRRKQPEPKKKRKGSQSEQPASKKQRTDDSQQKKKRKEAPDVTKMTMRELTKYNPKANPMQSTVEARKRRRELKKSKNGVNRTDEETSTNSSQSSNAGAEQQQDKSPDVEVACEENDLSTRLVPQLTVGEDGQIILNERSLTVEATQVERELDSDVVYESSNSYTTNHRYSKKPFYIKNWNEKETQRFYEILSKTGTDFTMMALRLPGRTRMEIKRKFKREEKRNPAKITQALKR